MIIGGATLLFSILFLPLEFKIWQLQKELSHLGKTKKILQNEQAKLKEDLFYYSSEGYIEEAAREELGLVKPGEILVVPAVPGKVQEPPRNNTKIH